VTAQDQATAQRIARIMRAARKRRALTQQVVAARLGISQGALSKIEHGLLIPSAPQWFEFCSLTDIPPESLRWGYIDHMAPLAAPMTAPPAPGGFKMPRRFLDGAALRVRALQPLIRFYRQARGEAGFAEFCRERKLDPDYFTVYDHPIHGDLGFELAGALKKAGSLLGDDLTPIVPHFADPESHGAFSARLREVPAGLPALRLLVEHASLYRADLEHSLHEAGSAELNLSPRVDLSVRAASSDAAMAHFDCRYWQELLAGASTVAGGGTARVQERGCVYRDGRGQLTFSWSG
jgi:DNA-binding XRE family transcriptional regulator